MTIVGSKWSQSLKSVVIDSSSSGTAHPYAIPRCLTLLTDFHEIRTLTVEGWKMENMDDDLRRLVKSWPKIRSLNLDQALISLSTLRIVAENCPKLRHLEIRLDTSTIPPFNTSSKSLGHKLEFLSLALEGVLSSNTQMPLECQLEIQIARHLDLIFPHLRFIHVQWHPSGINVSRTGICDLIKLYQNVRRGQ